MPNWIDALAVEVQRRQEMVGRVEANTPKILQALRAAIQEDIDRVNTELYDGRSIFEIEDASVPFYDFRITRADSDFEAQVRLRADDLQLHCRLQPRGSGFDFEVLADAEGEFSIVSRTEEVPLGEISRLILEPSIREGFNLD